MEKKLAPTERRHGRMRARVSRHDPAKGYRRRSGAYHLLPANGLSLVKSRNDGGRLFAGALLEASFIQRGLYCTRCPASDHRHTRRSVSVCHDIFIALTLPLLVVSATAPRPWYRELRGSRCNDMEKQTARPRASLAHFLSPPDSPVWSKN